MADGKTTLLKRIYTQLKDRKDIKIGYMPQNYMEDLDEHKKNYGSVMHKL